MHKWVCCCCSILPHFQVSQDAHDFFLPLAPTTQNSSFRYLAHGWARQYPKIGTWKKMKFSFFHERHTLSTSFDIFVVVTYRVTNFLPKLVTCYYFLWKKLNYHFLKSPIFGYCRWAILLAGQSRKHELFCPMEYLHIYTNPTQEHGITNWLRYFLGQNGRFPQETKFSLEWKNVTSMSFSVKLPKEDGKAQKGRSQKSTPVPTQKTPRKSDLLSSVKCELMSRTRKTKCEFSTFEEG